MSHVVLGLICGIIYGGLDVALMIPMKMEDKNRAMLGAFIHRFGEAFVICNAALPMAGWAKGITLGLLMSLPPAIITKSYGPILAIGAVGGAVIGYISG